MESKAKNALIHEMGPFLALFGIILRLFTYFEFLIAPSFQKGELQVLLDPFNDRITVFRLFVEGAL